MFEKSLVCRCSSHSVQKNLPRESSFFLTESKPHYAPDRLVDIEHIKLNIEVDLKAKSLFGTCTTRFSVVAPTVAQLRFDAVDLVVSKVTDVEGNLLKFEQNTKQILVTTSKALRSGDSSEIVFHYSVVEPRAGLYFIAPDKEYPNKPYQLWTQGQDQDNRYWIPCHDSPNEKASIEMLVTVDELFTAISNGKLEASSHDRDRKKKTFHYNLSIPQASYLITLCVGQFVQIDDKWTNAKGETIPVQYFTLAGRERETKVSFGKTPKMIDFYSKRIGYDYPYEKYAQTVAWDFIYGGMENTSATTQTEYTLHPETLDEEFSSEPLVAHELAHQWFGDLLTCKEWQHAWLNEGFATYFEYVWTEFEKGRDEALYEMYEDEKLYRSEDSSYRRPIVTNVYLNPSDIFDRHLYQKGGRVLHMLRNLLGEDTWWKAISLYVNTNAGKTVETIDFIRAIESVSGRSLGWFFDQWVFKAGHPDVKATFEWDNDTSRMKLSFAQQQKESNITGVFKLPMKFKAVTSEGEVVHDFMVTESEQTFWFSSREKPKFVSLNPENTVLMSLDFSPGRDLLIAQLREDKDMMGRVFAAKALAKDLSRVSVDALGEALVKDSFWGVSTDIAESLAKIGSARAFEFLKKALEKPLHPKARKAVMKAIGSFKNAESAEVAENVLKSDQSPFVQFEAGVALGKSKVVGVFEKLNSALGKRESWHDYYERGILLGLSELKWDDRVAPVLTKYTKRGYSMFLRRDAVNALAKWGAGRPALVLDTLMDLTRDSDYFVRLTSMDCLVTLGDPSAVPALKRVSEIHVEPRTYRSALTGMKALREGRTAHEDLEKLRADFDRLRAENKELLSRVEKLETPKTH